MKNTFNNSVGFGEGIRNFNDEHPDFDERPDLIASEENWGV